MEELLETLPNGAKVDPVTKRIVKAAPGTAWDSKKAREMALKRHAKKAQAVREAITDAVNSQNPEKAIKNFPEAAGAIVGQLVEEVVLDERKKPMDRVAVAKFALEQADDSPKSRIADLGGGEMGDAGMVISFAPATAEFVMKRLLDIKRGKQESDPQVVDATFEEVPSAPT
jgi:hypothetical protein